MTNPNSQALSLYDLNFYERDNQESPPENLSSLTFQCDSDSNPSLSEIDIDTEWLSQEYNHFPQSGPSSYLPGVSLGDIFSTNGTPTQPQQAYSQQNYSSVSESNSQLQVVENVAGPSHRVRDDGTHGLVKLEHFDYMELGNWAGDNNLSVQSSDEYNGRKSMYSSEMQKLYVQRDYEIPFSIHLDYDKIQKPENYSIAVQLVYTDLSSRYSPVLRCLVHMDKDGKNDYPSRIPHFVRCIDERAVYYKSEITRRCTVICPLEQPQPGVTHVTRNYMFTCLSSCKSAEHYGDGGIQSRPIAMVFLLLDKKQFIHGRFVMQVRVCASPLRDYAKHRKNMKNANERKPKRNITLRAGATQNNVVHANEDCTQMPSSSQETTYSDDETSNDINLSSLMRDVKWALLQKRSDNVVLKSRSKEVFSVIKLARMMCDNMRLLDDDNTNESQVPNCVRGQELQ